MRHCHVPKEFSIQRIGLVLAGVAGWLGVAQSGAIADTIIEVQGGTASIENAAYQRLRMAHPGTTLRVGDLIRPSSNTVVVIRCYSGSVRRVRSLVGLGDVCPDSVGRRFSQTGRGEDDFLLFLNGLFTYATQTREAQPLLQWNPVAGATTYQVQMLQGESVIWEDTVEGTNLAYEGPELEPGGRYTLVVSVMDEAGVEQPFRLLLRRLSQDEDAALQTALDQLDGENLSDEGRAIAQAQILMGVDYADELFPETVGLVMEAIATLKAVVNSGNETPYLHRVLGDLYLQTGQLDQAEYHYGRVIALTYEQTDLSSRAAAWVGLANLAAAEGDRNTARQQLQLAQVNYGAIEAGDRVEQINSWLERLD